MSLSYHDYSAIVESLDSNAGEVKRDEDLEMMAKFSLPSNLADSVKVMYNDDMDKNNLRLVKLQNHEGNTEYHIHNTTMMSGKSGNQSKLGFLGALKIMHNDALGELAQGKKVVLQTLAGSDQYEKYKLIANRLANRAGKKVHEGGLKPFVSNPFLKGPTLIIE